MRTEQFTDAVNTMDKRLRALEVTRQPIVSDWFDYNVSLFSYNASNVFNIDTNLDVGSEFQIGNKLRITQGGSYKYFYVIIVDTTNNRITVDAGSDRDWETLLAL